MSAPAEECTATPPVGSAAESAPEVAVQHIEAVETDPFSNKPPLSLWPQGAEKRGRNTPYSFPEKAILYGLFWKVVHRLSD
jgi:hypothetical protein